jgi:hypothetical protein
MEWEVWPRYPPEVGAWARLGRWRAGPGPGRGGFSESGELRAPAVRGHLPVAARLRPVAEDMHRIADVVQAGGPSLPYLYAVKARAGLARRGHRLDDGRGGPPLAVGGEEHVGAVVKMG